MADARKKRDDVAPPVVPAKQKPKHLEGLAYYCVYVPAIIVATLSALLFVELVDRFLLGDD